MSGERVQALLRLGVPDLDHVVVGTWDDDPAVVLDASDSGDVAHQNVETFAAVDVPHPKGGIPGSGNNPGMVEKYLLVKRPYYIKRE